LSQENAVQVENQWQQRIERAKRLAEEHSFAAEILGFYAVVVGFQQSFYGNLTESISTIDAANGNDIMANLPNWEMTERFGAFLRLMAREGPQKIREAALEMASSGKAAQFEPLTRFWNRSESGAAANEEDFFARAFLQPYAVWLRVQSKFSYRGPTAFACPFCRRKPGLGVLRALGEGGQRSLICSFCLAEWDFRRILCPGCGEEDHAKLPVYSTEQLPHVRVEACDGCRTYIKTVDLTKAGLGEPVVDEMAALPLDLWAREKGYSKLQVNLLQL
jgi:FdhE protein